MAVGSTGRVQPVNVSGSNQLLTGVVNVTAPGSKVRLPNVPCREITIIAKDENTGTIFVGDQNVSNVSYGVTLKTKDSFTFAINNANLLYIDSTVAGEGVSYVAI